MYKKMQHHRALDSIKLTPAVVSARSAPVNTTQPQTAYTNGVRRDMVTTTVSAQMSQFKKSPKVAIIREINEHKRRLDPTFFESNTDQKVFPVTETGDNIIYASDQTIVLDPGYYRGDLMKPDEWFDVDTNGKKTPWNPPGKTWRDQFPTDRQYDMTFPIPVHMLSGIHQESFTFHFENGPMSLQTLIDAVYNRTTRHDFVDGALHLRIPGHIIHAKLSAKGEEHQKALALKHQLHVYGIFIKSVHSTLPLNYACQLYTRSPGIANNGESDVPWFNNSGVDVHGEIGEPIDNHASYTRVYACNTSIVTEPEYSRLIQINQTVFWQLMKQYGPKNKDGNTDKEWYIIPAPDDSKQPTFDNVAQFVALDKFREFVQLAKAKKEEEPVVEVVIEGASAPVYLNVHTVTKDNPHSIETLMKLTRDGRDKGLSVVVNGQRRLEFIKGRKWRLWIPKKLFDDEMKRVFARLEKDTTIAYVSDGLRMALSPMLGTGTYTDGATNVTNPHWHALSKIASYYEQAKIPPPLIDLRITVDMYYGLHSGQGDV